VQSLLNVFTFKITKYVLHKKKQSHFKSNNFKPMKRPISQNFIGPIKNIRPIKKNLKDKKAKKNSLAAY